VPDIARESLLLREELHQAARDAERGRPPTTDRLWSLWERSVRVDNGVDQAVTLVRAGLSDEAKAAIARLRDAERKRNQRRPRRTANVVRIADRVRREA
jgi:hypothetical protein